MIFKQAFNRLRRDNTETTYYYGAEGLAAQYNSGTKKYFAYHYDNIGSTTLLTDIAGAAAERIAYGTYGELLTTVKNAVRFLYNGSYGVATDSNGLYYMRARYYNPDIKRFINQDIKAGDIGSSQSLNRYAYCEGNPVSMVAPFGLCGEDANDQGQKSKYSWLHTALDVAGLVFDVADVVNAAVYAMEGDWTNAAICVACAIPAVGAAVMGVAKTAKAVIKAKKAEKIASLAAEASRMTKNAANTLDTLSDTMKAVSKWGDNPLKLADGITAEAGSRAMKALEAGGDFAKESQKAVWEMKAVVGADGIRLSTKADEGASLLKHGFAGTDGVAKSAGQGSSEITRVRHYTNSKGLKGIQDSGIIYARDNNRVYLEMAKKKPLSSVDAESIYQLKPGKGKNYIEFDIATDLLEWVENPRYHIMELTVKGDVKIKNAKFFKRKG